MNLETWKCTDLYNNINNNNLALPILFMRPNDYLCVCFLLADSVMMQFYIIRYKTPIKKKISKKGENTTTGRYLGISSLVCLDKMWCEMTMRTH